MFALYTSTPVSLFLVLSWQSAAFPFSPSDSKSAAPNEHTCIHVFTGAYAWTMTVPNRDHEQLNGGAA